MKILVALCLFLFALAAEASGLGVAREKAVQIDQARLTSDAPSTSIMLQMFDGQTVMLQLDRHRKRSPTNHTWRGTVSGHPQTHVVLTVVNGSTAGMIYGLNGKNYRIEGGQIQELDASKFPPEGDSAPPKANQAAVVSPSADDGTLIDIMVVYSNQTAAAAGSAIASQIQNAVDAMNTAYANSGIVPRMRLVYSQQVNRTESGDFPTDLAWLATDATVANLRNQYGADLVSMFVEMTQYCGYGYIGPGSTVSFTVVNRSCSAGNLSFAHEEGHNFGARHDVYVDPSTTPYAYGHGWINPAESWRTIMAYNDGCAAAGKTCTRIPYFSNPGLTYGNPPDPLGDVATANVVKVINDNALSVSNYRQTVINPPPPPSIACTLSAQTTAPFVGTTDTLIDTCVGTPTSFIWTSCSSSTNTCDATSSVAGAVIYSVVASDGTTLDSDSIILNWQVPPPPDLTAPTVSILSPSNGAVILLSSKPPNLKIAASASDPDSPVSSMSIIVDGSTVASGTTNSISATWNFKKASRGTHTIKVSASDPAGNIGTATESFTLQ